MALKSDSPGTALQPDNQHKPIKKDSIIMALLLIIIGRRILYYHILFCSDAIITAALPLVLPLK